MGLYDDKNKLNREAAQVALEYSKATEKDIIELINSFVPKYLEFKQKFYSFANGQIKNEQREISALHKVLQNMKQNAIKMQISLDAYNEYITYSASIENKIENFEREIAREKVNQTKTGEVKKINLVLDKRYTIKNFDYLEYAQAKVQSYPKPYTSVEKASSFAKSYQNKLSYWVDSMISIRKDMESKQKKIDELKPQAISEEAEYNSFMEEYKQFESEVFDNFEYKLGQYLKKSPESEIKNRILKSLNATKFKEMKKDPKNFELITSKTCFNLIADVANKIINIQEQTNNKGME